MQDVECLGRIYHLVFQISEKARMRVIVVIVVVVMQPDPLLTRVRPSSA